LQIIFVLDYLVCVTLDYHVFFVQFLSPFSFVLLQVSFDGRDPDKVDFYFYFFSSFYDFLVYEHINESMLVIWIVSRKKDKNNCKWQLCKLQYVRTSHGCKPLKSILIFFQKRGKSDFKKKERKKEKHFVALLTSSSILKKSLHKRHFTLFIIEKMFSFC